MPYTFNTQIMAVTCSNYIDINHKLEGKVSVEGYY